MSLRSGEKRTRRMTILTAVGALVAFQALAIVGAGVAFAVTQCTYNPATDTINITIDPGDDPALAVETAADDLGTGAPAGSIAFSTDQGTTYAPCGSATNSNTVSVVVLGSPGNDEIFVIDEWSGDRFATSIAWAIDLGTNTVSGDWFYWWGSEVGGGSSGLPFDDTVVLTDSSFNLNGAVGELLGAENHWLYAGDGDDTLDGSALTKLLDAEGLGDDDWIAPGTFDGDDVDGGDGDDTLSYATRTTCTFVDNSGTAGQDTNCDGSNTGEEEDNVIDCFEVIETGSGNDTIDDNGCPATVAIPGDGDDEFDANDDSDTFSWETSSAGVVIDTDAQTATGQGSDTWEDAENFIGSEFDDTLLIDDNAPGSDVDSFSGLGGVDTVDASGATSGVAIVLDDLDPDADDLENAIGSPFNDFIGGNDLRNVLTGGDGDDEFSGEGGNDTLFGGLGNDFFDADAGADTVSFAQSANGVIVDLSLGFATGEGDDTFSNDVEIIVGSNFDDTITGGPFGGGGTVNFLFKGRAGADVLTGFNGNDTLKGAGGPDVIRGVGGEDTLAGGGGNDTLAGGGGFDVGKGGKGQDVCKGVEQKTSCGSANNPA